MSKSLITRKFRVGQKVITKSGLVGKVISSAIYGVANGKPMWFAWVEYRIQVEGRLKTFYRREGELTEQRHVHKTGLGIQCNKCSKVRVDSTNAKWADPTPRNIEKAFLQNYLSDINA